MQLKSKFSIITKYLSTLSKIYKLSREVPLPEDIKSQMAQEGVFALLERNPALPNMGIKEIKAILNDLRSSGAAEFLNHVDPDTALSLPYIYKPNENNLIEIDGKNYYAVSITEPEPPREAKRRQTVNGTEYQKGQTIPGTSGEIILMDAETGNPETMNFTEIAPRIRRPVSIRQNTLNKINNEIRLWNEKVSSIENSTGATRLEAQVLAAKDRIQSRINDLNGQETSIQNSIRNPRDVSQGYEAWLNYLKDNYQNFNPRDIFDTLLFLHQSNPPELLTKLESGEIRVPEDVRRVLINIATQEQAKKQEKTQKEQEKRQEEMQRREEELPEGKEPIETELVPLTLEDVPEKKYEVPSKYKTLHTWTSSLNHALAGIRRDKIDLENILATFEGLIRYITGIRRSNEFLSSPEGRGVIDELKQFLNAAQVFIKRYNVDIMENGKVNSKLLGRSGTPGNAFIAIRLNNIYTIIQRNIRDIEVKQLATQEQVRVPTPAPVPTPTMPVSYTKDKIIKMASLLWKAFEDRMSLK